MVDVRLGVSTKIASEPEAQLHAALERYDSKLSLRILAQFPNLDVHASLGTRRGRLLREAARRGLTKPAQELLERGAEVDAPDECGDAALARAAMNERYSTVELLLRWEANAARVGRDGKTADEWCAHVGHAHLAARLAQAAAKARLRASGPKQSDVVVEWGPRIRAGAMVFQKTAFVHARRASEDGVLQTKEGEQRAYKAGDFVVHDASRGQYATDAESFVRRYDYEGAEEARTPAFADEGFLWCRPIGRIWAHRVTALEAERFFPTGSFQSAWGEMLTLNADDYLAMPYPGGGEVYRIAALTFAKSYERLRG